MFRKVFGALIALWATAAQAQMVDEYCNDYWFVRNQAYDQAGYCFKSALGQALFDNSDCTPGDVTLSRENQSIVDRIVEITKDSGCQIDTASTTLPIPLVHLRLQLEDLAARDEHSGAGCWGWTGPSFMLWPGHREAGVPLSEVMPGDYISMMHWTPEAPDDWVYLEIKRNGEPVGMGWTTFEMDWELCTRMAG